MISQFSDKKIIFFGTPHFAAFLLQELIHFKYNIIAVVTATDKPSGRGWKLKFSEVKTIAVKHSIKILQPNSLKDQVFVDELKNLNADLFIIIAFRILPEIIWNMPKWGTINLHGSLLPNYRGAAPIQWAIINGEKQTGLTTFILQQRVDCGNILLQKKIAITDNETFLSLYNKMLLQAPELLFETLEKIFNKAIKPIEQNQLPQINCNYAPKIKNEDCYINWNKDKTKVYNFIRGLNPIPGAITVDSNKNLYKIFDVEMADMKPNLAYGTVFKKNNEVFVATKDSCLKIISWQLSGKKMMKIKDFLNGNKLPEKFIHFDER